MKVFIRSAAAVSPQHTLDEHVFRQAAAVYAGNRMQCIEPDYTNFADVKQIRRMSRIVKMGVAAATTCLQKAGVAMPGAIITGTAYGCLEDTAVFLNRMIEYKEELLTPTAFIQSTHNTVGAQIALMLKCHHFNNTIVHRGFSFENALLDACLLLQDEGMHDVLVGGIDEITNDSHAILSRFGLYRSGAVNGEGAAFFLLAGTPGEKGLAALQGVRTFYKPSGQTEIEGNILAFLESQDLSPEAVDLILTGRNGDPQNDAVYDGITQNIFAGKKTIAFKQLCGEYPTAGSFALWLASAIMKDQMLPPWFGNETPVAAPVKNILIYNHHQHIHHSLLLIAAC